MWYKDVVIGGEVEMLVAILRSPVGTINRNSRGVGAQGSMTWQELLWWRIFLGKLGLWCDGVGRDLTIGVTIIILEPTKDTQLIRTLVECSRNGSLSVSIHLTSQEKFLYY